MKKTLAFILAALIALTAIAVVPVSAAYVDLGDLRFSLDSGTAALYSCSKSALNVGIPRNINVNNTTYTVTEIVAGAFKDCTALTSISIPDTITKINQEAFMGCSSLTSVSIPYGVTRINRMTFADCSSLTNISIPNSVTRIDFGAFGGCSSLTTISLPDSIKNINLMAFIPMPSLLSIEVDPNHDYYSSFDGVMYDDYPGGKALIFCPAGKTSVMIPNSVTAIDSWAFYHSAVTTVYYGGTKSQWNLIEIEGQKTDYNDAVLNAKKYYYCVYDYEDYYYDVTSENEVTIGACLVNAQTISIPSEIDGNPVTAISENAFSSCTDLQTVYFSGTEEDWDAISVASNNTPLQNASIVFGSSAHEHNYVAAVTAPTCTEAGYTTYTCFECGDSYTADETAALGHNFENGVCTRCDEIDPNYSAVTFGDADGDNAINTKDLTMLRRYLASYDPSTGESSITVLAGADANGDGSVTSKDLTLLRRYLASYDPSTGTASVVLGPQN